MSTSNQSGDDANQLYSNDTLGDNNQNPGLAQRHWLLGILDTFKNWIGVIAVVGIAALVLDLTEIPPWLGTYVRLTAVAVVVAHLFSGSIVNAIDFADYHWILDLGIHSGDFGFYKLGEDKFSDVVVCGSDEMYQRRSPVKGRVLFGSELRELEKGDEDHAHPMHGHSENDYEPVHVPESGIFVNSTWHSEMDPVELERRRHQLDEAVTDLSILASKSLALEAKQSSIVREKVRSIVRSIVMDIDGATIPHHDQVEDVIEKEMKRSSNYNFGQASDQAQAESESIQTDQPTTSDQGGEGGE